MKKTLMLVAIAALGLAAAPGAVGDAVAQAKGGALKKVVYVQPNPSAINSFQLHVAIGEGYFKDEGLNVRVETVDGSAPVLQALAAGQAQIGRPGPGAGAARARARRRRRVPLQRAADQLVRHRGQARLRLQDARRPQGQGDRHRHARRRRGRLRPRHPQRSRHAGAARLHLHPGGRRRPGGGRLPARRHRGLCRRHQRCRDPQSRAASRCATSRRRSS